METDDQTQPEGRQLSILSMFAPALDLFSYASHLSAIVLAPTYLVSLIGISKITQSISAGYKTL